METWLVSQIVNNHENWFGHMWKSGGPLEGFTRPSATAIKDMYHPIIDDEGVFCSRVHIRKGKYQVQCMDTDQNMIDIDTINNCTVVPLVEVKGIFMKPRGYNPDIVLRGLVYIPPEKKHVENTTDFFLFHTEDTDDNDYPDYATEDEDTDNESEIDEDETPSQIPVEVSPAEVTPTTTKKLDDKTLQALMKATEDLKRPPLKLLKNNSIVQIANISSSVSLNL